MNSEPDYLPIHTDNDHEYDSIGEEVVAFSENTYTGTITSSCINLCNTIMGSGMLAMPSALAATGLGVGILLIVLCGLLSAFGLHLLSRVAHSVGRKSSFNSCALITYPALAVWSKPN